MNTRKMVIGAVLVIIGLPVVLVLIVAVSVRNRTNGTIVSSGQRREYLLYVPKSYDRAKPTPLVISMHGAAEWPAQQMNLSRWNRLADEHGFIVVYPAGSTCPRSGTWTGGPVSWGMSDSSRSFMGPPIQLFRTTVVGRRFPPATCFRASRPGRQTGSKKPVWNEPGRFCGRCGCYRRRIH